MTSAANQDTYGPRGWTQNANPWGNGPGPQWRQPGDSGGNWANSDSANGNWGGQPWAGPPFWYPIGISRPAAIAFTILGFLFWWPVGLAILIYMIGSGRMGCFGRRRRAMYRQWMEQGGPNWTGPNGTGSGWVGPWANWKTWACGASNQAGTSSGNRAFDEYKAETLRRMEEEQKDFGAFLERLRFAKDKAEFDQFMAERRARPPAPPTDDQPTAG